MPAAEHLDESGPFALVVDGKTKGYAETAEVARHLGRSTKRKFKVVPAADAPKAPVKTLPSGKTKPVRPPRKKAATPKPDDEKAEARAEAKAEARTEAKAEHPGSEFLEQAADREQERKVAAKDAGERQDGEAKQKRRKSNGKPESEPAKAKRTAKRTADDKSRSVKCPTCGAKPGDACPRANGRPQPTSHKARREAAAK